MDAVAACRELSEPDFVSEIPVRNRRREKKGISSVARTIRVPSPWGISVQWPSVGTKIRSLVPAVWEWLSMRQMTGESRMRNH